jgi:diguanylate cyclase (GGDEF)-like protein
MGYPEMMRDITEQMRREESKIKREILKNYPIIDEITGLYNGKYLHVRLDEEMARVKHYHRQLSFIMLELGHTHNSDTTIENFDNVLRKVSDIIHSCIRYDIDLAFRTRDDSFAIILPEVNIDHADTIAQSIKQHIQKEEMGNITMYAGVAQYDCHDRVEDLIKSAHDALCKDKKESKNTWRRKPFPSLARSES